MYSNGTNRRHCHKPSTILEVHVYLTLVNGGAGHSYLHHQRRRSQHTLRHPQPPHTAPTVGPHVNFAAPPLASPSGCPKSLGHFLPTMDAPGGHRGRPALHVSGF